MTISISDFDLGWLVGLIEGEGCFTWRKKPAYRAGGTPLIAVGMTDIDVIARAAFLLGVSFRESKNHRRQEHYKPFWRLEVTGERAAEWMRTLQPHMGDRRQARISELLVMWATRRPLARAGRRKGSIPWNKGLSTGPSWNAGVLKDTCVNGHDMADAYVTSGRRNCRACQRDRERRYRERRRTA